MKQLIILGLALLISFVSYGQNRNYKRIGSIEDKVEARRIAYLTTELELTVEESQKFWPLYNEHNKTLKI